jgi:ATP-binding cassette subfamily C protein
MLEKIKKDLHYNFYPIIYFMKEYRGRTLAIIVLVLLSGIAESLSFAALLPVLSFTLEGTTGEKSVLKDTIINFFSYIKLTPSLTMTLILIIVLMTAKSLMIFEALKSITYTSVLVIADFRKKILDSFLKAKWTFFVSNKAGDFASAFGTEPEKASNSYIAGGRIVSDGILIIFYGLMAMTISWQVTACAFILGGFSAIILKRYILIGKTSSDDQNKFQRSFMSILLDGLKNIKTIKSTGSENRLKEITNEQIDNLSSATIKGYNSALALQNLSEPIQIVGMCAGLWALVNYFHMKLEEIFVLTILFHRTIQRLNILQKYYHQVVTAAPSFWFIHNLLESASKNSEKMDGIIKPTFEHAIVYKNLSFKYDHKDVLSNLNLTIPKGQFVALIGQSGAGKTTCVDLLLGLHRPQSGSVFIDQNNLNDIDLKQWRSKIGYVQQESFLFHDSIFNNITLKDSNITEYQVIEALKTAEAYEFILKFEDGIHTSVGEHGNRLSGGQRQRIALARALVRRPELLVLDESTTALDPHTEQEIVSTLKRLKGTVTIVAISHQPAIKEAADCVYFLSAGKIDSNPSLLSSEQ